jgi:hypothetical protein
MNQRVCGCGENLAAAVKACVRLAQRIGPQQDLRNKQVRKSMVWWNTLSVFVGWVLDDWWCTSDNLPGCCTGFMTFGSVECTRYKTHIPRQGHSLASAHPGQLQLATTK